MLAMLDDEASFEGIFDQQQQFGDEEQAERAEQEGAGVLLSDAGGSAASVGCTEAAIPIVDLFALLNGADSCVVVQKRCLGVAKGPATPQNAIAQAWQQVAPPLHNL
jgi:hypothetical protein